MTSTNLHYHAFLLRFWRDDETVPWRIQLEDPHTGERRGFTSIEQMVAYLDERLETSDSPEGTQS
ncbi:MAG: hypothetical protein H6636_05975 [Anaerolineales bacterium]|nr:hypothetical protein [Anaerolineales bacterium]